MRTLFAFCTCALTIAGQACLNDTDTLRMAKEKFPGAVDVIAGRFERNPPLYYQMRIDRLTPLVAQDPTKLGYYDDIAVAYDRIGDDKTAMAWMAKKKVQLDRLGRAAPEYHLYSYHANLGTFQIHDWLHSGATLASISQAEQARDNIEKAIEIKPNAHFGREPVQLAAMKWIIDVKKGKVQRGFTPYLYTTIPKQEIQEGILGLIVLGAAWESVDMYEALADNPFLYVKSTTMVHLARLRAQELVSSGKKSMIPSVTRGVSASLSYTDPLTEDFQKLRANAEAYNRNRQEFMLAKLKAGKHPDTDPDFWKGYRETPPFQPAWTFSEVTHRLGAFGMILVAWGTASGLAILLFVLVRKRNGRALHV